MRDYKGAGIFVTAKNMRFYIFAIMKALRLIFDIHPPHIFSLILRTDHIPFLKDKYSEDLRYASN